MASTKSSRKKRPKSLNFHNKSKILSLLFIILGAGIMMVTAINKTSAQIPSQKEISQSSQYLPKPAKLYIPKLAKILYVSDGYVADNRWTVSQTGVSFLTTSALPGKRGNSVIYGHNLKDILGGLPTLAIGDHIYVTLTNGEIIRYEVSEKKEIKPTQVEILNDSKDYRLTIYTCSGFLDQSRFVVIAKQVST